MSNKNTIDTAAKSKVKQAPMITRKIGNTTFAVNVHFSEKSNETFADKVMRLIQNDTDINDIC